VEAEGGGGCLLLLLLRGAEAEGGGGCCCCCCCCCTAVIFPCHLQGTLKDAEIPSTTTTSGGGCAFPAAFEHMSSPLLANVL
jgi:hypothetical protein